MIIVNLLLTGVNPRIHSIASIGAVEFLNPENFYYRECRIWDGAEISDDTTKITGFTESELRDINKSPLNKVFRDFLSWVSNVNDRTIGGARCNLYRDFLRTTAQRYGIYYSFSKKLVDLHSIIYLNHLIRGIQVPLNRNTSDINLNVMLQYSGLPEESFPNHALNGAKMQAECFHRISYGDPLFDEFRQYEIPEYLRQNKKLTKKSLWSRIF